ncbi:hypothetical protein GMLC_21070 [Geomonas limicola]|uniref:Methyltransferase type 11 domain-containing protein n=1 Tax=Geomonas limicola TaxID=2740186 RepID=A0A6V8N7J9_9BACT|nr:class I SAM-dependent methyltransferase [Geomonas limicola]GFO68528.1 hypothetical protein GMLC_21070 [Geomonas limicola]
MWLNLGCGLRPLPGYLNVDRFGKPDLRHDLETFPWPWPDNSVSKVLMIHVLEHLGRDPEIFRRIIQELYRVCCDRAQIHLVVPHPKHDTFLSDPTHVRPISEETLYLLSRAKNLEFLRAGASNSCLALEWEVNFELTDIIYHFDARWKARRASGAISTEELLEAVLNHNNVIEMLEMTLTVDKSAP